FEALHVLAAVPFQVDVLADQFQSVEAPLLGDDFLRIRNWQRSGSALRSSSIDADARAVFAAFIRIHAALFPVTSCRDRHCRRRTELARRGKS
ncbi:hypothetical protein KPA97_68335, partial [Burkholderia cenocepacia]|nr:hypothetical protein [Burkholderia cenocepacia]